MRKKKKKLKLKAVVWEDACTYTNESLEEVKGHPPELVETYGVIMSSDSNYMIVQTHNSHGSCDDWIKIPATLIRKIKC